MTACQKYGSHVEYLNKDRKGKDFTFEEGKKVFAVCAISGCKGTPAVMAVVVLLETVVSSRAHASS